MNESEIRESYSRLTKYLIENKLSITTMESATSGQIASLITDTEGSSAIMKGAFVTYSNEAKIQQGVAPEIIEKYSVYSEETAKAMAEDVLTRWSLEKQGVAVNRELPKSFLYFTGTGKENIFREAY